MMTKAQYGGVEFLYRGKILQLEAVLILLKKSVYLKPE